MNPGPETRSPCSPAHADRTSTRGECARQGVGAGATAGADALGIARTNSFDSDSEDSGSNSEVSFAAAAGTRPPCSGQTLWKARGEQ